MYVRLLHRRSICHHVAIASLAVQLVGCLNPNKDDPPQLGPTYISERAAATTGEEANNLEQNYRLLFGSGLQKKIAALKPAAQTATVPYTGSMYASGKGGTNAGGALGRYDQAYGTTAVAWERASAFHAGGLEAWHGHCNGYAAAASRHAEPPRSVTVNNVTFSPTDIKALLAEIYMSGGAVWLAGKLCEEPVQSLDKNPLNRADPTVMDNCEDSNPGAFHLALTNIIGGANPVPLAVELSPDRQVWNYPVYRYTCTNCTSSVTNPWYEISAAQAATIISGTSVSSYPFNRNAKSFYDVKLQLYLSEAVDNETTGKQIVKLQPLRYILEVNADGDIIGGEWARESRLDHPDLLWLPLDPTTPNPNATDVNRRANVHVSASKVLELWRESWRQAGVTAPDEGLQWPYWSQKWARYYDFNIEINGATNGTVFLTGPVKGRLNLYRPRWKGGSAHLTLNEQAIGDVNLGGSGDFEIKPKPGINFLTINMQKGNDKERYDLRLYAVY